MTDSVKKILLEKLRKALLPDFTNKLTWLFGSAGVALIAGPAVFRLVGKFSSEVYGVPLEVEFFSEDRSGYGVLLCLLAVVQNIGYQLKGALSEASALRELDRKHEMDMQEARHSHDRLMKEAESERGMAGVRRAHDIKVLNELVEIFPFEDSCNALVVAADVGIYDSFQESLEQLANLHHVSQKLYTPLAEEARAKLIIQAKDTQAVLSSNLVTDPRFSGRYVPCFEQKHNGLQEVFYESQRKMRKACYALIFAYEHFVSVLQEETLWGVDA